MDNRQTRNTRFIEIDLISMARVLLSKLWLIVIVGMLAACAVYVLTKTFIKPIYRCEFSAYVNNQRIQTDTTALSSQDLAAAQQLTRTFSYILESNTILSASLDSIDSDLTYKECREMVSTEIKEETELISVYVDTEDPELSYEIASAIAKTAPNHLADIVQGSSMKIVDQPVMPDGKYKPSYTVFAFIGFVLGMLPVIVWLLVRHYRDDSIKGEIELENFFSIPVLGSIPDMDKAEKATGKGYYGYGYGHSSNNKKGAKQ